MKTTLIIPDDVIKALKRRAVETGTTLSRTVEETLRRGLRVDGSRGQRLRPLPTYSAGRPLVDIADREALYEAMEGGDYFRRRYQPAGLRRRS